MQATSQMGPRPKPTVERFDFQRIDAAKVTSTPQGFLRVSGNLTRVGVLPYYRADGSVFRELRLPEEVFREDSYSTMRLAPVTDLHGGMVGPDNVRDLQIGVVGEDVAHDDKFLTGSALIQRADSIAAVRDRRRCELSPGYRCWVEVKSGDWHGQKFDGIQRDIVYNHLAIGPKGWGRSGSEVALRMDGLSSDAAIARMDSYELGMFLRDRFSLLNMTEGEIAKRLQVDVFELGMLLDFGTANRKTLDSIAGLIDVDVETLEGFLPAYEKGNRYVSGKRDSNDGQPSKRGSVPMHKIKIVLDGVSYEVEIPEALAANFESSIGKLKARADKVDGLEGQLVAARKETADVQTKLDNASNPTTIRAAIAARAKLVDDVKRIAPKLEVDDKLDDNGLKVAALVAAGYPKTTFDGRDAGFVDGVFVGALAVAKPAGENTDTAAPGTRSAGPAPTTRTDGDNAPPVDKYDSDAARERMIERNRKMASGKLDATGPGTFNA